MHRNAVVDLELKENTFPLLLREFDLRIRNLLTMIELAVSETHTASAEGYRAKLMESISGLHRLYWNKGQSHALRELKGIIEHSVSPFCANGARIDAFGPDLLLKPDLVLVLHLVFHELALNAKKYGALSASPGFVDVVWKIKDIPGGGRDLEILWSERGGPAVKHPGPSGFGLRLVKKALEGHGAVRIDFNPAGLTCFMIVDPGTSQ
jgi:two-component sensor histidine kinase